MKLGVTLDGALGASVSKRIGRDVRLNAAVTLKDGKPTVGMMITARW